MTRSVTKTTLCSTLAIATAMVMAPQRAAAQSLNGTWTATGATVDQSVLNNTLVTVTGSQAVINWNASGAPLDGSGNRIFQGAGTTATFGSGTDFAVLNRVASGAAPIIFNGTVEGRVDGVLGNGTIYFSNPNGIIAGAGSRFDVGSLGLTTLPIADDGQGNWMTDFGGTSPTVVFGPGGGFVTTSTGAQLNANGAGKYIALVSPKITHRGIIRTDGGAALVASSGATITFSPSSLYTIEMDAAGGDTSPLTVDGGTITRNSATIGGDHRAYLTALTPNSANTALITGGAQLGFDIAGSAGVEGNTVVLSVGGPVFSGSPTWDLNQNGGVDINGAIFTSSVNAMGRNGITIRDTIGQTSFSENLSLLTQGGDIRVVASVGTIDIGGDLIADTSIYAPPSIPTGLGHTIALAASGTNSALLVGGATTLTANGYGGGATVTNPNGYYGTGGTILIRASSGGYVQFAGNTTATANGYGGNADVNGIGGDGNGGTMLIDTFSGDTSTIIFAGTTLLQANGYGSSIGECTNCNVVGGDGLGGTITVRAAETTSIINAFNGFTVEALGTGASGDLASGVGTGGVVNLLATNNGQLTVAGETLVTANGVGGSASAFQADGGAGFGGTINVHASGNNSGINLNNTELYADGLGGGFFGCTNCSITGGVGEGGTVIIEGSGAGSKLLDFSMLYAQAVGIGGAGDFAGGDGLGGTVNFYTSAGTSTNVSGMFLLFADGVGGFGLGEGNGGDGTGGVAEIGTRTGQTAGGTIAIPTATAAFVTAEGIGGNAGGFGAGGDGVGGTASVTTNGVTLTTGHDFFIRADARGGNSSAGQGGNALGGTALFGQSGGSATLQRALILHAYGEGGNGATGGDGTGGISQITASGTTLQTGAASLPAAVTIVSDAYGRGGTANGQAGQSGSGSGLGGISYFGALSGATVNGRGFRSDVRGTGGTSSGASGSGTGGGTSFVVDASQANFTAQILLQANGVGGSASGAGDQAGNGQGGTAVMTASAGGDISAPSINQIVSGTGGASFNGDGGTGGDGFGGTGTLRTIGAGSTIVTTDFARVGVSGNGGQSIGGQGGNGLGGSATANANGGIIDVLLLGLIATGGAQSGHSAGNATGGTVLARASNGGQILAVDASLLARGSAGFFNNGSGGVGTGGAITVDSTGASLFSVSGASTFDASGTGSSTSAAAGATSGFGGSIFINPSSGGTITFGDSLTADASGYGGYAFNDLGTGGMGDGGSVTLSISGGTLNGATSMNLVADGIGGGTGNDCTAPCGFVGAIGIGGLVALYGGAAGSTIALGASTTMSAIGEGASGGTGTGGLGNGGTTTVGTNGGAISGGELTMDASGHGGQSGSAAAGIASGGISTMQIDAGSVTLTGDLRMDATATAGVSNSGTGATAGGGTARLSLNSATASVDIGGSTILDTSAIGGNAIGGNGGAATAGLTAIFGSSVGGSGQFDGGVSLLANATGGHSTDGNGGTATGGIARANSQGAAMNFSSTLSTSADAIGGSGINGGDALGADVDALHLSGIIAQNGGTVAVAGSTSITATTLGGDAFGFGKGGDALSFRLVPDGIGGQVINGYSGIFVSSNAAGASSVTLTSLSVDTSATAGNGGFGAASLDGGAGGKAAGGEISISTRNSATGTNLILVDNMIVDSSGTGGDGGFGGVATSGRTGGAGGDASSGFIAITAGAGNGRVDSGNLTIRAVATGGDGGSGGNADSPGGTTGAGGSGGAANSTGFALGVVSNNTTLSDYGSAVFGDINADVRAFGGNGGDTGNGAPTLGSAGNGGVAAGGFNTLYSRGGDVQFGIVNVDSSAFGGDGGFSNIGGVGGNAYAGTVQALSTTRFEHPGQLGSLIVAELIGNASAYAGGGVTSGLALVDSSFGPAWLGIEVLGGSSAEFGRLYLLQEAANGVVGTTIPSYVNVIGSTLDVTNDLSITTGGNIQIAVDDGSVTAGSVLFSAANFLAPAIPVVTMGSITADSIFVASGANVRIDADLISTGFENSILLDAPGFIQTGALTSVNDVYVDAGTSISTLAINAGGLVDLVALGLIQTGDINSDGNQTVTAGGQFVAGDLSAGGAITVLASNGVSAGTIGAAGDISVRGNVGDVLTDDVTSNGGAVDLRSATGIAVGHVAAATTLNILSGGNIDALSLDAGGLNYVRASGNASLGTITGSGSADIATSGTVTTGNVTIGGALDLRTQLGMTVGNLDAVEYIDLRSSGSIALGNATSGQTVNIITPETLTGGNITAGNSVFARSLLAMNLGAISAGIVMPSTAQGAPYLVRLASGAALTVGSVNALGDVGFSTPMTLATGNVTSGGGIMALVSGNMSFGSLTTTAPTGYVYLGDNSMAALGGAFETFDRTPILAGSPTATAGSITIAGPVTGGRLLAAAGTNFSAGAVDVDGGVSVLSATGDIGFAGILAATGAISLNAGGDIALADVDGGWVMGLFANGAVTAGNIDTGAALEIFADLGASLGDVTAVGHIYVSAVNGAISAGSLTGTAVEMEVGGAIATGSITSGSYIDILAGGNISVGAVRSEGYTDIDSAGLLTASTVSAGADVALWGELGVTAGNVDAGIVNPDTSSSAVYDIGIGSGASGDVGLGSLTSAGSIAVAAGGNVSTGAIEGAGDAVIMVDGNALLGPVNVPGTFGVTGYDMLAQAGGKGDFNPQVVLDFLFEGNAPFTGGDVTFTGTVDAIDVFVLAGGSIFGLDFEAVNGMSLIASNDISVGGLFSDGLIEASAGDALIINGILAGFALDLSAGGDLTIGDLTSNSAISFSAGGNLTVGNLTTEAATQGDFVAFIAPSPLDISLRSGGDLVTGVLLSGGSIYLGAGGGIDAGQLTAVGAVLALAAGDISTGAIAAGDEIYIAGIGEEARGGFIGDGFDPGPVVASLPETFAGSISTGALDGTRITLAASGDVGVTSATASGDALIFGGDVTIGDLTASDVIVMATGLASVAGQWAAEDVSVASNDIAIGEGSAIEGGWVSINSTNEAGMFLGDGLTGTGFMLSQAEASRISGSRLEFDSIGAMTIGALTLDATGMAVDETMEFEAEESIRIVGDMVINGLVDPASEIVFGAPQFMLDAGTGSLALNNGSALGGTLNIYAQQVWVAEGDILTRLLADPNYSGRDADLAVAPVGVSGNVISASIINVEFESYEATSTPYTLLVQNTGTAAIPQGFFATEANSTLGEGASGLIDLVVYGQGQTDGGVISGIAVRDALMADDDPARFTANSTINGCSVSGGSECGQPTPPNEPPPIADPGTVIADEIVLFSAAVEDKPLFGNEEQIVENLEEMIDGSEPDAETAEEQAKQEEEDAAEEASSPISPPTPLFDTRPLNAKTSTDEPISGGGNPALIGSQAEPTGGQE